MAGSKSLSGKEHGFVRCAWARNELSIRYHDEEWGVPQHDDRKLFEFLLLEGAQAGLSWDTILRKRENYRVAFDRFDPERIARYDQRRIRSLLKDPGIVPQPVEDRRRSPERTSLPECAGGSGKF